MFSNLSGLKSSLRGLPLTRGSYLTLVRFYHRFKRAFPVRYKKWIKTTESFVSYYPSANDIHFKLVCDVSSIDAAQLLRIINSVLAQNYPHWNLDLLIKTNLKLDEAIEKLAAQFDQINITKIKEGALNLYDVSTLGKLRDAKCHSTKWHILLTNQFVLSKNCLTEFNAFINTHIEKLNMVYTDHDELGRFSARQKPCFKPDWNPDLFLTQEYIHHCCAFRSEALALSNVVVPPFTREDLYQAILKISQLSSGNVGHLPKVMFHKISDLEPLKPEKIKRVIKHCMPATGAKVVLSDTNDMRLQWPLHDEPLVSLIIPTRNGYNILKQAIDSILDKTTYTNYEIVIIDNQSDCKATLTYLHELTLTHSNISVFQYNHAFNYSAINNFAVQKAKGSVIGFINNDVEVINNEWLSEMLSHAIRPEVGCVGAKLYYPNNKIQHAGVIVGMYGCAGHSHKLYQRDSRGYFGRLMHVQNYSALTAACLVVEKALFEKVNGFNEKDLPVQFNDVDLCLKIKALGFHNVWTPFAELYHHESISRGEDLTKEQIERSAIEVQYMHQVWNTDNYSDPAYNPNLTLQREDFSVVPQRK